jgi:Putative peptidoglycan-binding domain-containing protein
MESVVQVVREHGDVKYGAHGEFVKVIQRQLMRAGFPPGGGADGSFGTGTRAAIRMFETANNADKVDGVVDMAIATMIDQDAKTGPAPKPIGQPLIHKATGWPHDDLASLIAFYGDPRGGASVNPRWFSQNIVTVKVPFQLHYDRQPVDSITVHRKCSEAIVQAFENLYEAFGRDYRAIAAANLDKYSGVGNYRMVRGSASKLSCHAFWAAIDIDAEHLPIGHTNPAKNGMEAEAIAAFEKTGAYWGGRFSRPDPMHFQYAHE